VSDDHPLGAVWVRSERMPDGSYGIGFATGGLTWSMPAAGAQRYASAIVNRAIQAEHEAAILAALTAAGMDEGVIAKLVVDVRTERAMHGISHRVTRPLRLSPGVGFDGDPFLLVEADGVEPWQWSPADTRRHALHVLEVLAAADADELLRKVLTVDMGLGPDTAAGFIGSLAAHWPKDGPA
jgi:hypothetical protein